MIRFTSFSLSRLTAISPKPAAYNSYFQEGASKAGKVFLETKILKNGRQPLENNSPKPLSKDEFEKTECMSFEKFEKNHGFRAKQKGIPIEKAYSNYIEGMYSNYLNRLQGPDTGSICS